MNIVLGKYNINFSWLTEIGNPEQAYRCVLVLDFLNLAVAMEGNCHSDCGIRHKKRDIRHKIKKQTRFLYKFDRLLRSRPASSLAKGALKQQPFERDFNSFCS